MPRGRKKLNPEVVSGEGVADSCVGTIDARVGARICSRRKFLQLSQKQMAEKLGITFQQVQKYEKGMNRIGAGRLYSIANILGVDVSYFFNEIEAENKAADGVLPEYSDGHDVSFLREEDRYLREGRCGFKFDPLDGSEAVTLLKAYYSLPPKARLALVQMLTSLQEAYHKNGEHFNV